MITFNHSFKKQLYVLSVMAPNSIRLGDMCIVQNVSVVRIGIHCLLWTFPTEEAVKIKVYPKVQGPSKDVRQKAMSTALRSCILVLLLLRWPVGTEDAMYPNLWVLLSRRLVSISLCSIITSTCSPRRRNCQPGTFPLPVGGGVSCLITYVLCLSNKLANVSVP